MSRRRVASRREFGLALAGVPLAVAVAHAEDKKSSTASVEEELIAIVRARYGKHLSEDQIDELKTRITRGRARLEVMRKYPLRNSDDPAFAFRADLP